MYINVSTLRVTAIEEHLYGVIKSKVTTCPMREYYTHFSEKIKIKTDTMSLQVNYF